MNSPTPRSTNISMQAAQNKHAENDTFQKNHKNITHNLSKLYALVCLIIPLVYWPPAFDAAGLPRETLLAVSAGLVISIFAITTAQTAAAVKWHPLQLLMIALLVWACASVLWSVDRGSSLLGITQLASLITLALVSSQLSIDKVFEYLLPLTLLAATLAGLIGIGQHFGFNPLELRQLAPPASTFVNRNYAANFFDLIMPVAFIFLISQKYPSKPKSLFAATAFITSLGFLLICRSRGSWLGMIVELIAIIYVFIKQPEFKAIFYQSLLRHKYSLIISLAIVAAIAAIPTSIGPTATAKLDTMFSNATGTSSHLRLLIYENAFDGFLNRPLTGVGYGAFIMGFAPYIDAVHPITIVDQNSIIQYLHSDPIQMFFELGLPGGILSIAIFLLSIAMAWRIIKSSTVNLQRFLALGLLMALLASGAHAWVDFPLRLPTSAFFFWLWCGLIVGLYLNIFPGKALKPHRISWLIVSILGLCFTLYSASLYTAYLRANRDVRTAMFHALQNDCPTVFKLTDRAMNNFGLDHLTRFWYTKVYTHCNAPAKTKLAAMNRILALDPNMPLAHLTRARIELANNDLESAATDFNAYRILLPHRPEGYIGMARIANKLDKTSLARYWLRLAIKHAPNSSEVKHLVKQLIR